MSADFSQEEVDALLRGVTGESDEPVADEAGVEGVRPTTSPPRNASSGRMPTLELHQRALRGRYLRIGLFNYMHRNAEVSAGLIKVQKYAEFVRNPGGADQSQPDHCQAARHRAGRVRPNLVFLVVDNMFGGDGRFHTRVEGRDFTPTEQRIIRGMLDVVFAEYVRLGTGVQSAAREFIRSEMNSQFANIATPSEVVVSTSLSVEFGGSQAEMHICFPYSMLEPIRDLLYSSMQSDHLTSDRRWIKLLTRRLQTAEVELACPFGTAGEPARHRHMRVGDVIPPRGAAGAAGRGSTACRCSNAARARATALRVARGALHHRRGQRTPMIPGAQNG